MIRIFPFLIQFLVRHWIRGVVVLVVVVVRISSSSSRTKGRGQKMAEDAV